MSTLSESVRRLLRRFKHPEYIAGLVERDEAVDGRLTDLEQELVEIAARIRILEKAGNPRGIGRD